MSPFPATTTSEIWNTTFGVYVRSGGKQKMVFFDPWNFSIPSKDYIEILLYLFYQ